MNKIPDCKVCDNTRVVEYHDAIYGVRKVKCKQCQEAQFRLKLLRQSKIPESYLDYEFSDYDITIGGNEKNNAVNEKILGDVQGLLNHKMENIIKIGANFIFTGTRTSGKTLLATLMLKKIILDYGYNGFYINAENLILFANTQSRNIAGNYNFSLELLENINFLVVDDIDLIVNTLIPPMAKMVIINIIKSRIQLKKSCILTSKLSFSSLFKDGNFINDLEHKSIPFALQGQYKRSCDDMINALMK